MRPLHVLQLLFFTAYRPRAITEGPNSRRVGQSKVASRHQRQIPSQSESQVKLKGDVVTADMQAATPPRPSAKQQNSGFPFNSKPHTFGPHDGSPYSPSESLKDVKMAAVASPLAERSTGQIFDEPLSSADHALDYGIKRDA